MIIQYYQEIGNGIKIIERKISLFIIKDWLVKQKILLMSKELYLDQKNWQQAYTNGFSISTN